MIDRNGLPIPKTAIIGAGGFLGSRLTTAHRAIHPDCIGTYYKNGSPTLDLYNPDIFSFDLRSQGYKDVIIAAGVIDVYRCEWEKEYTYPRNVTGTLELVRQIHKEGLKPIFISTDWVFRGDTGNYADDASPDPICGYGRQKEDTEKGIPQICNDRYLIVRLSRMFSLEKGDRSTPDQMAHLLSQGEKVYAARDQVFGPLLTDDAVRAILGLQQVDATGIVNINSPELWSRLDLASEVADALDVERTLIESISLDDIGDHISRPKRTNMICNRLRKLAPMNFTPMTQCIKQIADNYKD